MTSRKPQRRLYCALVALAWVAMLALVAAMVALAPTPARAQTAGTVRIPEASALYRHRVEQAAAEVWGVNGSAARLAAQLHQESAWRANARSPVGAEGLAQFMPATSRWIAQAFPDQLGQFDPWNPQQAALAAALYDRWLYDRVQPIGFQALSACSRWVFALRGYNGGETWVLRERGLAVAGRADANDWRQVERFRARSPAAHRENIGYPRKILLTLEPAYIRAGWPGKAVCP